MWDASITPVATSSAASAVLHEQPRLKAGRPKGSVSTGPRRNNKQQQQQQQALQQEEQEQQPSAAKQATDLHISLEVHAMAELLNVPVSNRAAWTKAVTRNRPSATVERVQRALGLLHELLPHATEKQLQTAVRRHHVVIGSFFQNAEPNMQLLQQRLGLDEQETQAMALRHLGLLLTVPSTLARRITSMLALLTPILGAEHAVAVLRDTPQLLLMRERTVAAKWAAMTAQHEDRVQVLGLEASTVGGLLRYSPKRLARLQYLKTLAAEAANNAAAGASAAATAAASGGQAAGGAAAGGAAAGGAAAGGAAGRGAAGSGAGRLAVDAAASWAAGGYGALAAGKRGPGHKKGAAAGAPAAKGRTHTLGTVLMAPDAEFATWHPGFQDWLQQQSPQMEVVVSSR